MVVLSAVAVVAGDRGLGVVGMVTTVIATSQMLVTMLQATVARQALRRHRPIPMVLQVHRPIPMVLQALLPNFRHLLTMMGRFIIMHRLTGLTLDLTSLLTCTHMCNTMYNSVDQANSTLL
jgi:hypothetical protein